jgi:hypothetical protein
VSGSVASEGLLVAALVDDGSDVLGLGGVDVQVLQAGLRRVYPASQQGGSGKRSTP